MELIQSINTDALRMVEALSPSFGSRGIGAGVDWRQIALRLAQLRRHGDLQEANLLETHACGGIWTPQRLVNEGYSYEEADLPKVQCRLCGIALDSEEHRTYECEATQKKLCHRFPHDKHATAFCHWAHRGCASRFRCGPQL